MPSRDSWLRPRAATSTLSVPVPTWARVSTGVVVVLEAVGLLVRTVGLERRTPLLSMDAPFSLARMSVAAVFTAAAAFAAVGAARHPGRRTWWTAVSGVVGIAAVVKAGGDVHVWALQLIGGYEHLIRGFLLSAAAAGAVLSWLAWLSRGERRDRRRVLLWLTGYAIASVGLSTVSSALAQVSTAAGTWATWVEETGEAVTAVGLLLAVVLGVAPRLVLPPGWVLRRPEDVLSAEPVAVNRPAAPPRAGC